MEKSARNLTLRSFILFVAISFSGCVSIQLPSYIQDKNPYTKEFYSDFADTINATKQALEAYGWEISNTADPSVFEQTQTSKSSSGKQTLIFTENKTTSLLLFSRYTHLNVFVRSQKNGTEVEIRYLVVTRFPLKQFKDYRNNGYVKKLFNAISQKLDK